MPIPGGSGLCSGRRFTTSPAGGALYVPGVRSSGSVGGVKTRMIYDRVLRLRLILPGRRSAGVGGRGGEWQEFKAARRDALYSVVVNFVIAQSSSTSFVLSSYLSTSRFLHFADRRKIFITRFDLIVSSKYRIALPAREPLGRDRLISLRPARDGKSSLAYRE